MRCCSRFATPSPAAGVDGDRIPALRLEGHEDAVGYARVQQGRRRGQRSGWHLKDPGAIHAATATPALMGRSVADAVQGPIGLIDRADLALSEPSWLVPGTERANRADAQRAVTREVEQRDLGCRRGQQHPRGRADRDRWPLVREGPQRARTRA